MFFSFFSRDEQVLIDYKEVGGVRAGQRVEITLSLRVSVVSVFSEQQPSLGAALALTMCDFYLPVS